MVRRSNYRMAQAIPLTDPRGVLGGDSVVTMNQDLDNSLSAVAPVISPTLIEGMSAGSFHVAEKATKGAAALALRQLFVYGSNIGGSIVLARILPADQFGYYSIVIFSVNFLSIFGGTGFASNLLRMSDDPSLEEKRAVFSAQELIICFIFVLIWFISPRLAESYHLAANGSLFFRLMGVGLVLTSLMVIPQIQMERELAFDKLALIEGSQAVVFNACAILFALKGLGYISFALALVLRTASGAILALIISPWSPGLQWRSKAIKEHLQFGFTLQLGQLITVARDSLTPVFAGLFLGAADVGYITWAAFVAGYAVLIVAPLQRLYLPLFSRVQNDRRELARFLNHAMWAANIVSAPLTLITLALLPPIVTLVFGAKWLYAMSLVYCFAFGNLFIPSCSPMLAVLNALGRSRTTLAFTGLSMTVIWGLGVPLIIKYGIWGFGYATIVTHLVNLLLYWIIWRELHVNPWKVYWPSWPLASLSGLVANLLYQIRRPNNLAWLSLYALGGLLIYAIGVWFTSSRRLRLIMNLLRRSKGEHPARG
jgi:teichuronic acid exporter